MEKTFNFNRFGKYFLYDLKSRWSDLGIFFLIFALFPFILYLIYIIFATIAGDGLFNLLSGESVNGPTLMARFITFAIVTGLFVILFPARAYGFITEKKAGSDWLMLPDGFGVADDMYVNMEIGLKEDGKLDEVKEAVYNLFREKGGSEERAQLSRDVIDVYGRKIIEHGMGRW